MVFYVLEMIHGAFDGYNFTSKTEYNFIIRKNKNTNTTTNQGKPQGKRNLKRFPFLFFTKSFKYYIIKKEKEK